MRSPFARFVARMAAIATMLISFLLLDSFIGGQLSFVGLAMLLPSAFLVTAGLLRLSAQPKKHKKAPQKNVRVLQQKHHGTSAKRVA